TLATRTNRLVVVSAPGDPGSGVPVTPSRAMTAVKNAGSAGRRRGRPSPRTLTAAELEASTWLLREPGSGTRATAEAFLDGIGISPRILTFGSNGAVVESVRIGLGVTLVSADAVAADLRAGALEEWRHPGLPIDRPWHLLARAGEPLAPTPERFVTHLLNSGWERPIASA
ncbi:MAG: LysR substrate-binding domain-containing protein, partial [Acidimicrobiia bacterium]